MSDTNNSPYVLNAQERAHIAELVNTLTAAQGRAAAGVPETEACSVCALFRVAARQHPDRIAAADRDQWYVCPECQYGLQFNTASVEETVMAKTAVASTTATDQAAALLAQAEALAAECRKMAEMLMETPVDALSPTYDNHEAAATDPENEPASAAETTASDAATAADDDPAAEAAAPPPPHSEPDGDEEPDEDDAPSKKAAADQPPYPTEPMSAMLAALEAQHKALSALAARVEALSQGAAPAAEAEAAPVAAPTAPVTAAAVRDEMTTEAAAEVVHDMVLNGTGRTLDLSTDAGVAAWLERVKRGAQGTDWQQAAAELQDTHTPATAALVPTTKRVAAAGETPVADRDEGGDGLSLSGLFMRRRPTAARR